MAEVILVAGRGPMAARAVRSCQQAGAKAVAVYSEADVNALHVRMADESVLIGAAAPESSYLDISALLEAAQVSGAQAVLPVHSVLGGSSEFALAIRQAGLLWIGADPDVLEEVRRTGRGTDALADSESPGSVIGVADGFRIDGLVLRRTRAAGANLFWTSAEEPDRLGIEGLPPAATVLATLSDLIVELGWRGLVSVDFAPDGTPLRIFGGVPTELGLVEFRAGRDLLRAALALAESGSPPTGSPGAPAAVGGAVRATATPRAGQPASIAEFIGPVGEGVMWEPGYATGDPLWPWYDPVLTVLGVCGDDLCAALAGFQDATDAVRIAGIPNDLDELRAQADDVAGRLRDGSP